jgi:putative transcriptional regulator
VRPIQIIRSRLGVSQQVLATELGCSQANISYYERGQPMPPDTAKKLIAFARTKGLALSYDHVYGAAEVPRMTEVSDG